MKFWCWMVLGFFFGLVSKQLWFEIWYPSGNLDRQLGMLHCYVCLPAGVPLAIKRERNWYKLGTKHWGTWLRKHRHQNKQNMWKKKEPQKQDMWEKKNHRNPISVIPKMARARAHFITVYLVLLILTFKTNLYESWKSKFVTGWWF